MLLCRSTAVLCTRQNLLPLAILSLLLIRTPLLQLPACKCGIKIAGEHKGGKLCGLERGQLQSSVLHLYMPEASARGEKGAELQPALATSVGCAPTALMVCSKQLLVYGT